MTDYNGDGLTDIVISSRLLDIIYEDQIADLTFTVVQPLGYQQAPVRVLLNKSSAVSAIDFVLAELSEETTALPSSDDYPYSRSRWHLGLVYDPRQSYQLPMDINGDGLNDVLFIPPYDFDIDGAAIRPLCESLDDPMSCWYAQINLGGAIQPDAPDVNPISDGLYSDPINITLPANIQTSLQENIRVLPPASSAGRVVAPRYGALIRPFDWNNDGVTELMIPRSIDTGICLHMFHRDGTGSPQPDLIGLYCPTNMVDEFTTWDEMINEDTTGAQIIGGSVHEVGFGHRDKSNYNMGIIEFDLTVQTGSISIDTRLFEPDQTGLIGSARSYSDDFYGDGVNDLINIYGCIDNNTGPPVGVGINGSNCTTLLLSPYTDAGPAYGNLIKNHALTPYGTSTGASTTPGEFRGYYISRPTNNRTSDGRQGLILDMMTGVTDGFGNRYNWDYAPLSSGTPERAPETDVPLYSIPSRDIDQDYLSVYGNNEYFYFTSSMYVVSAFHASNGLIDTSMADSPLLLQNTTYYGYEEAVYNNQGRGFQGFRKIVSEQLVTNPDGIPDDPENNLRSVSVFHQLFPLAGRLEATYTQLAAGSYVVTQDRDASSGRFTLPSSLLGSTVNRWSCRSVSGAYLPLCNVETGDLSSAQAEIAGQSDHGIYHPVLAGDPALATLTSGAATISTQRELDTVAYATTYSAQRYDAYGNVTERVTRLHNAMDPSETDDVFITERTNYNYSNDADSDWWLGKLLGSVNEKHIQYDYSGVLNPDDWIAVTQLLDYDSLTRKPDCQLVVAGNHSTSTCDTSFSADLDWQHTATVYDSYGNPGSITVDASNLNASRITLTDFAASDGYFPAIVTNAAGHTVSTTFNAREGNPIMIEDANELLSRMDYDPFGRQTMSWSPQTPASDWGDYNDHYAPRSRVAYSKVSDLTACPGAPVSAVYCTVSIADGQPLIRQYFDRLNRVLAVRSNGFDDEVISTTTYNARGQVIAETVPVYADATEPAAKTTYAYDALGRTTTKSRPGSHSASAVLYTHYQHLGLKTRIWVGSSQSLPTGNCAVSATLIMGLSDTLCVERTYLANDWLHTTIDAHGEQTRFWYDGQGNPLIIRDSQGNLTQAQYNPLGHRTRLEDPDMGVWVYTYNGLGELQSQIDANGQQTVYSYDELGRQTLRVVSHPNDPELGSISDVWTYDEANGGQTRYGLLTSERRTQGMLQFNGDEPVPFQADTWQKFYAHDAALRPSGYSTTIHPHSYGNQGNVALLNASTYTVAMAYDNYFGRIKSITYPQSGVGEYTRYDINGFVIEQGHSNDYADVNSYWHRIEAMSASGQVERERYGNGVVQDYDHDPRTQQMTETRISLGGDHLNQTHSYSHDLFGNLMEQNRFALAGTSTETFSYDHQHRLRNSTRSGAGGSDSINYSYDELGNLLSKSDYGSNYEYGFGVAPGNCHATPVSIPGPHAVSRVMAINNGGSYEYGYDANGNLICSTNSHNGPMQIHYDPTNKPFRVQRGSQQTEFWYGSDDQRYFQRDNNAGDTIYIGKLFEQKGNVKKYYLGNYAVFTADASAGDKVTYLHKERLGSIIAISDEIGDNVSGTGRGFDPFGKPREADWDNVPPAPGDDLNGYDTTTRGFTGHEHLNGTDLIHMNGRAYDYNLGRFLSVDPVIQFPANSQSLNPYSYIMNNPMAGTDPSGYTIECNGTDSCTVTVDEINSINLNEDGSFSITTDSGTFNVSNDQAAKALVAIASGAEGGSTTDSGVNVSGLGGSAGRASIDQLTEILGDAFSGKLSVGVARAGGSEGFFGRGGSSCSDSRCRAASAVLEFIAAGTAHTLSPLTSLFRHDEHVVNAYTGQVLTPREAYDAKILLFMEAATAGATSFATRAFKFSDEALDAVDAFVTSGVGTRMERFRNLAETSFQVGEDSFSINPHIINSLRKSGRRHIDPESMMRALGTKPTPGTPGSRVFVDPETGTRFFVNDSNIVVGVHPSTFQ